MSILESLILGAVQGATEFLPVSSSGHLVLFRNILNLQEVPALFDVILHVATLLVVMFFFRKRIMTLLGALGRFLIRRSREEDQESLRFIVVVLAATAATAFVGFGLNEIEAETKPRLVGLLFIFTGLLLIALRKASAGGGYDRLNWKFGIFTGLAQGIGVLPGVSRSGITIAASRFGGLDREKAGEYSFILSIPAIAGALLLELKDLDSLTAAAAPTVIAAGFAAAVVVGLLSLTLLVRMIRSGRLYLFSLYLIPLGLLALILF